MKSHVNAWVKVQRARIHQLAYFVHLRPWPMHSDALKTYPSPKYYQGEGFRIRAGTDPPISHCSTSKSISFAV